MPHALANPAILAGPSVAPATRPLPIPRYLEQVYWWAYVHPSAVRLFEREWLVNLILFGNYGRLRDAALAELGETVTGRTLQVACVYGNLTARLHQRLAPDAQLDVVDIVPVQLDNLAAKLPTDARVALLQGDSSSLAQADGSCDQVLLFFLLHEQPEHVRRRTLGEAMRVVKPGGKVVIIDYHRPAAWHPLRLLMTGVFRKLEPYALDLWDQEVTHFIPRRAQPASVRKTTYYGGLYQRLVLTRCPP
jgi:ubiquinone/menaquinone biosynthesis C-methylase UbiE